MKKIFLLVFLAGIILMANGQTRLEVIASGGGYFSNSDGSLSWTLGETIVETVNNGSINIILTQGFQQPDEKVDTAIGIRSIPQNSVFANVYPNPTVGNIRIDLKYDNTARIKIELINMWGQILHSEEMDVEKAQLNNYQLDVSRLAGGMYMFRLSDEGKLLSTYKFQKVGS